MKYRAGEDGLDVKGLIACLKKTDPGGLAELRDRGGRLGGKIQGKSDGKHSPNGSLITALKKVKGL